jgi:hypothetical protein
MSAPEPGSGEKSAFSTGALIGSNAVAIGIYLIAASAGWIDPELKDVPGAAGGGAVVWFLLAVPIFFVSLLGNGACAVIALIRRNRNGRQSFFRWSWLAVLAMWLVAVALDFSRHGT